MEMFFISKKLDILFMGEDVIGFEESADSFRYSFSSLNDNCIDKKPISIFLKEFKVFIVIKFLIGKNRDRY